MNKSIDHTNLKAFATIEDITKLCEEAITYNFKTVCVNPYYISLAKDILKDTSVEVCTVIGFPLGMNSKETKVYEAIDAVSKGADEIDMVINIGALKDKEYEYVKSEIEEIRDSIGGRTLKVIIETCYLTDEEKVEVCRCASLAGAQFVKTSTGFGTGGATKEDVALMRASILDTMSVKASGGIKNLSDLNDMVNAGANRIGASSGVNIIKEYKGE